MSIGPRLVARPSLVAGLLSAALAGCSGGGAPAPEPPAATAPPAVASGAAEDLPQPVEVLPEGVRAIASQAFTGDFDQMVKRRLIRVGVVVNRTFYFVDHGEQRGVAYEMGRAFEEHVNRKLKTNPGTKVNVFFVPLPRDLMAQALLEGRVDCVVAAAIVRPELQALVDFSDPTRTDVSEVVVTGPGSPALASPHDLSGQRVYARKDSSAWQSVVSLNESLKAKGRPPVALQEVPGNLEDDDLLEMVSAGLIPAVVVHDYLAAFWKQIFKDLTVHGGVALRTGASIAVPIRKNSPLLAAELNAFLKKYGLGTAFGNVIDKRYLASTRFAKQAASEAERRKFLQMVSLFRKYSEQYSLDYLLMAAQGYQESGLDQNAKSRVGAIGVMQVMPATGKELKVGDIRKLEPNIHAGVKYIRFMMDQYYKDEPMTPLDKGLFTFASYNAGPGRIRQLRREAEKRGLDPNVWFGNVEQIASERIGRETVTYVSNIYKYYVAYSLIAAEDERRAKSKAAVGSAQ